MSEQPINGFLFQNPDDEDIAREELNKIQYISDKLTDDPESILSVYNKMIESKIFITPIGHEYLHQMQEYLLKSSQISDEMIQPIPVLISYKEALHYKELENEYLELKSQLPEKSDASAPAEETVPEKFMRKYRLAGFAIALLIAMVIAMFVIALKSSTPNILNYRTEIENEYAGWAEELTEKENDLREWEIELNNREQ